MGTMLNAPQEVYRSVAFWRDPSTWLRDMNLSRQFWIFFTAAFFFDAGFSVYFFLFNLYLLDYGFRERSIGLVGGAMTLGSLLGTLPVGRLVRKFGVQPLLVFCFIAAPLVNALRTFCMWDTAQIGMAFLTGLVMSSWGVCFLTAVARLTNLKNRAAAFSLIFSVSVGTSALGGVVCGCLPRWLEIAGFTMQAAAVKRIILLLSCGVALVGLIAVMRLFVPGQPIEEEALPPRSRWLHGWRLHPFLKRFLPLMALWAAVLAAFNPFANVYLSRDLHIPLTRIGLIFSTAQIVQLCMGLLTPLVIRRLGLMNGIFVTQVAAAMMLAALAGAAGRVAVLLYLGFSAAQWMCSPGLYNLLMNETPDKQRSNAAAMVLFCNALAGSAATAGAGLLFARFGYPTVLFGISAAAITVAVLSRLIIKPRAEELPAVIQGC